MIEVYRVGEQGQGRWTLSPVATGRVPLKSPVNTILLRKYGCVTEGPYFDAEVAQLTPTTPPSHPAWSALPRQSPDQLSIDSPTPGPALVQLKRSASPLPIPANSFSAINSKKKKTEHTSMHSQPAPSRLPRFPLPDLRNNLPFWVHYLCAHTINDLQSRNLAEEMVFLHFHQQEKCLAGDSTLARQRKIFIVGAETGYLEKMLFETERISTWNEFSAEVSRLMLSGKSIIADWRQGLPY